MSKQGVHKRINRYAVSFLLGVVKELRAQSKKQQMASRSAGYQRYDCGADGPQADGYLCPKNKFRETLPGEDGGLDFGRYPYAKINRKPAH